MARNLLLGGVFLAGAFAVVPVAAEELGGKRAEGRVLANQ